ncbi:MAG TPA: alpha-amylase family glycosyl hydrolase, partial [Rhodospirillales bacterium]|nr:alpha-amylase family glycosyl hydrolase [Rhodospirillales bacterium]
MTEIPEAPRATYRLQFNKDFTFGDASRIAPYLGRLGVSHVYASPYLKARAGSTHGYDITDHNAFNPEIGDEDAFEAFGDTLARNGLGQILDFVPNHMGIGRDDNAWWLDVLEWGEESPYAGYFDIDWNPAKPELRGKVLIPVLGDHYGRVLEAGDLRLSFDAGAGSFDVRYFEHRFPVTPGEYERILRALLRRYRGTQPRNEGPDGETMVAIEDLIAQFRDVRDWAPTIRQQSARRAEGERLKLQLAELMAASPNLAASIDTTLAELNAADDPDALGWKHELLEAQHYRLAHWRVAAEEINYRRFFQINELAGIRVELPAVFDDTHRLVLDLIRRGRVHGLRIDHVDGLFDPKQYLRRLQDSAREALAVRTNGSGGEGAEPLFWVVVEKILAPHERLREDWPIAGTTGYEFLNRVHGLFLDP